MKVMVPDLSKAVVICKVSSLSEAHHGCGFTFKIGSYLRAPQETNAESAFPLFRCEEQSNVTDKYDASYRLLTQ